MNYLVINKGEKSAFLPYNEQYQLFSNVEKALAHAKSLGFCDPFGMGICDSIAMATIYQAGGVHVQILPIETK